MTRPNDLSDKPLRHLARLVLELGQDEEACARCRADLADYAEAEIEGRAATQLYPEVRQHLEVCLACQEYYSDQLTLAHQEAVNELPELTKTPRFDLSFLPASSGKQTKTGQLPPKPAVSWTLLAQSLAERWFGGMALAPARALSETPVTVERHLLFAEAAETPWGLAGVEVVAQGEAKVVEIQVNVAFAQAPVEPVQATLSWSDQSVTVMLDEQGCARFENIALENLFDVDTRQARDDVRLSLSL